MEPHVDEEVKTPPFTREIQKFVKFNDTQSQEAVANILYADMAAGLLPEIRGPFSTKGLKFRDLLFQKIAAEFGHPDEEPSDDLEPI
jgi:hypothetical protein